MKKLKSIATGAVLVAASLLPVAAAASKAPWESMEYRRCVDEMAAGLVRDCSGVERQAERSLSPPGMAEARESLEFRYCQDLSAAGFVHDCSHLDHDDET